MKIANFKWVVVFGIVALVLSACSSNASTTVIPLARAETQTPWIIHVPVTVTPQPATITPLPTAELKTTPSRTATRPAAVKPAATATKPPTAPVVAAPPPSAAPACSYGTVTLREPDNNALRQTKATGVGGDTFRFIWDPPASLAGESDPSVGYLLEMVSRRGTFTNGANVYIAHNKFLRDNKLYIFDKPNVSALASGDDVLVTWKVTIIRISGSFNESDPTVRPAGTITTCGAPTPARTIQLKTFE